jgi:hypothetical protein
LTVNCEDNAGYFNKSQINFKPALDVFNSSLYDPLTVFDVSFDAATGTPITEINAGNFPPLLPENEKLLSSPATRYKNLRLRGERTSQSSYKGTVDSRKRIRNGRKGPSGFE